MDNAAVSPRASTPPEKSETDKADDSTVKFKTEDTPEPNNLHKKSTLSRRGSRFKSAQEGDAKRDNSFWDEDSYTVERMWKVYNSEALNQASFEIKRWVDEVDSILVFTGLFSATVATLLSESYKKLEPNVPGAAASDNIFALSTAPLRTYERANLLFTLSLGISVSCALLAVIVQHWARRYESLRRQRRSRDYKTVHKQLRLFRSAAISRHWVVRFTNTIQSLLHISVLLFFAGLTEFFIPINLPSAQTILAVSITFGTIYVIFTICPIFLHDTIVRTPLSSVILLLISIPRNIIQRPSQFLRACLSAPRSLLRLHAIIGRLTHSKVKSTIQLFVYELNDAECTELVSGLHIFYSPEPELLEKSCVYFAGICTLLNSEFTKSTNSRFSLGYKISQTNRLLSPENSDIHWWNMCLIDALRRCHNTQPFSWDVRYAAHCFRIHSALIEFDLCPAIDGTSSSPLTDYFSRDILVGLQLVQSHRHDQVRVAARCFQAIVAARLPLEFGEQDKRLFCDFIGLSDNDSLPESLEDRIIDILTALVKFLVTNVLDQRKEYGPETKTKQQSSNAPRKKSAEVLDYVLCNTLRSIDFADYSKSADEQKITDSKSACEAFTKAMSEAGIDRPKSALVFSRIVEEIKEADQNLGDRLIGYVRFLQRALRSLQDNNNAGVGGNQTDTSQIRGEEDSQDVQDKKSVSSQEKTDPLPTSKESDLEKGLGTSTSVKEVSV